MKEEAASHRLVDVMLSGDISHRNSAGHCNPCCSICMGILLIIIAPYATGLRLRKTQTRQPSALNHLWRSFGTQKVTM